MELTPEQIAQYGGILDLIPGVGDLIKKLTPIIQQKIVRGFLTIPEKAESENGEQTD